MTEAEAVRYVCEFVRDTRLSVSRAVDEVWKDIKPIDNPERLIKFGIAMQAMAKLKGRGGYQEEPDVIRPSIATNGNGSTKTHQVSVKHAPYTSKKYVVSVEILHEIHYNVGGRTKPLAACNRHDMILLASGMQKIEDGSYRHRKVFEYIGKRLLDLKKDKVEDLATGEQTKIARMMTELRRMQFPSDLPDLKRAVPAITGEIKKAAAG